MMSEGDPSRTDESTEQIADSPPIVEQSSDTSLLDLLLKFLETPGNVLLVQRPPGTGKTTLALELLHRVEGPRIGRHTIPPQRLYVSSRVSPPRLRKHFPWINQVIDSGSERVAGTEFHTGTSDFHVSQADSILSKILNIKHSRQRSLIVVDSWEGAQRNVTDEGRRMLESAILSAPDDSRVGVILVSESGEASELAHLVDGVVTLSLSEFEGRRVRTLAVNKLRGLRIQSNTGLFTLDKGRFGFLANEEPMDNTSTKARIPEPVAHSTSAFSTGSSDLDRMLKGGIRRGSSLLLDLHNSVSPPEMRLLLRILVANFVNQGGGSFIVPSSTISSENVADALRRCVGEKALDDRVRIVEFNTALPARKWRFPLKGVMKEDALLFDVCWKELKPVSSSIVIASDFDKIAQVYGEDLFLPGLAEIGANMRDSGALNIGMASRPTKLREDFLRIADYHLKMQNINGSPVIYGVKPFTNIYGVEYSFPGGYPSLKLTEIV